MRVAGQVHRDKEEAKHATAAIKVRSLPHAAGARGGGKSHH
jgi:hypothetical protein